MIESKRFEPIITEFLDGHKVRAFHADGSRFWWYIPRPGYYAFAVPSLAPLINPDIVEDFPGLKEILQPYEESRENLLEFRATGLGKKLINHQYVELFNRQGGNRWVRKDYLQLFPKCHYYQASDKSLSPIYCTNAGTLLLEGIILPFNMKNEKE